VRARNGILTKETEDRVTSSYRARNENATATTLIIEHRLAPGWKLADGQTPVESTADAQRFRVVLPPAKETPLEVRELRHGESQVMIADMDSAMIALLSTTGMPAAALEQALKPILAKKAELAGIERRVEALQNDRNTIGQDQQRLRENMKALRGSPEEKQLLQRYTRQLNDQETRLDELQGQLARATTELEKLRGELAALINNVSFDLTAG
jgi:DNA repair exonuclease SbcCD ATPase subunit